MLKVQEFLQTHSLKELRETHGVNSGLAGHKVGLNYDQILASEKDPLACECRGLVIARKDGAILSKETPLGETVVLNHGMDRFFNLSVGQKLELNGCSILEKLDGTCGFLYYDQFMAEWCVGTRSIPNADHQIDGFSGKTFRSLFEECLPVSFGEFTQNVNKRHCFCFEITSPVNLVVVQYNDFKVTLLAARDLDSGKEFLPKAWGGVSVVKRYSLGSLEEIFDFVSAADPLELEGFVVRNDFTFFRVKVKNPSYLAYNRIRDRVAKNPRGFLELILLGKHDDVFPFLPSYLEETGREVLRKFAKFSSLQDQAWLSLPKDSRKSLALACKVQPNVWLAYQMARFDGKCNSFDSFIQTHKVDGSFKDSFLDSILKSLETC